VTEQSFSPALEAKNLVKTYSQGRDKPAIEAVRGLNFAVSPGTVFGVLGPNGAGKSTTVKILATLTRADSGSASVAGFDVAREADMVRHSIGFVAQKQVSDPMDTGRENLVLAGQLQGMSRRDAKARAHELLARFSLTDSADRLVKTYSGGMARKLDVAIGLMHRPRVLFLDEPTTGLDPEARAHMWAELDSMSRDERMTMVLTTHYLEEADRLADNLMIIDHGEVVASGTPEALKSDLQGDAIVIELLPEASASTALQVLSQVPGLSEIRDDGRTLRSRASTGAAVLPQVLAELDRHNVPVSTATVARPSLDDVYLRHTGRSFVAEVLSDQTTAVEADSSLGVETNEAERV